MSTKRDEARLREEEIVARHKRDTGLVSAAPSAGGSWEGLRKMQIVKTDDGV